MILGMHLRHFLLSQKIGDKGIITFNGRIGKFFCIFFIFDGNSSVLVNELLTSNSGNFDKVKLL